METKDTNGNLKTLQSKLRASEDLRFAAESKLGQLEELYQNLFNHLADEVHMWKLIREKEGSIKTCSAHYLGKAKRKDNRKNCR